MPDNDGLIRGAVALEKDKVQLLYRPSTNQAWSVIYSSTTDEADVSPIGFGANGQLLVYSHNGTDFWGLHSFDPVAKDVGACLFRDSNNDIVRAVLSPAGALLGAFYEADRIKFQALDPNYQKVQASLDAALPDTVNVPVSMTADGSKIIYLCFSDRDPGAYYLVDAAKNEFGIVGRSGPWIKPQQMAPVQPIQFSARDGLLVHGYLTLPQTANPTNLPLVMFPHGGPAARDSWRFDPEVQFLANRGYAVLQINFRGSVGYGLKFHEAGFKEWGGKMQDDITDGIKWAIAKGIADPQRIAIFGASYGGYAALMGLITTPELFKCAICYAGVTDVRSITRKARLRGEIRGHFERVLREEIGDYRADKARLREISPVNLADKISAPLLLAYGAQDPIVDIAQARAFAKALKKNKKPFELIVEEHEGHGFSSESARSNLLQRVDLFLRQNLRQ